MLLATYIIDGNKYYCRVVLLHADFKIVCYKHLGLEGFCCHSFKGGIK